MPHSTIIQVKTLGDACTVPGGIALRRRAGDGAFMVQDFNQREGEQHPNYCNGAYDLTLVEALEEFHRRAARAERYDKGGALIPESVTYAECRANRDDGEDAYFAEIVDDEDNRHWSDLIFDAPNADEALALARDIADSTGELQRGLSLQVRGPFVIPAIPACGLVE
jgi:hypothetical protein